MPRFDHRQGDFAEMPRLLVYEMGTHYLDTFRFLFGEPESIYARLHRVSPQLAGEDVQLITVGYPDLTCIINHSWASVPVPGVDAPSETPPQNPPPRLEIDGTEGTLILKADGTMHLYSDTGQRQWYFDWDVRLNSRIAAQQHFIDCLESGVEFETSGAETLKTMALVYAAYQSHEETRVVSPRELLSPR